MSAIGKNELDQKYKYGPRTAGLLMTETGARLIRRSFSGVPEQKAVTGCSLEVGSGRGRLRVLMALGCRKS